MKKASININNRTSHLYIKGISFGLILGMVLILILTTIFYFWDMNNNLINPLEFIILIICIMFSCLYVTKRVSSKGWMHGLIVGGLYYFVLLIINILILDSDVTILSTLPKIVFFLTTGLIGGCLGVNMR